MAHSFSAKKRIRQNLKRKLRNRRRAVNLKSTIKTFTDLVQAGKLDEAKQAYPKVAKAIDQIAAKGTIHKNAAARHKSRLAKKLNAPAKSA